MHTGAQAQESIARRGPSLSPVADTRILMRVTSSYYHTHAIAALASQYCCVFPDALLEDLALDLSPHPEVEAVAVVDRAGRPRGILRRRHVHAMLSRPYAWEVFKRSSVLEAMEEAPTVHQETHYLSVFADAREHIYGEDPRYYVLVDDSGRYTGMVSTRDMLVYSYRRIMEDLSLARTIQQRIHPAEQEIHRPGLSCLTFTSMSQGIGGDYLNIRSYRPGTWFILMGDVSGKGIAASLVASLLDGIFRTYRGKEGAEGLLTHLNAHLYHLFALEKFLTAVLVVAREGSPTVTIYDMGHSYLFLIREGRIKRLKTHQSNLPLGIHPELSPVANTLTLKEGDVLFAHTDGLTEQHNPEGATFSYDRITRAVDAWDGNEIRTLKDLILHEHLTFRDSHPQEDDITFFLLTIYPP